MVKIYKEQFGRGPTKTVTSYAGPNVLITTLENSLTPVERRMAEMGEHQRLRDARMFFQYATMRASSSAPWSRSPAARCAPS